MGYVVRTTALFIALTLIFMGIGAVLWHFMFDGTSESMWLIMGVFILLATAINLFSFFFSKKIVLRAHKVRLITRSDNDRDSRRLYNIVEGLAGSAAMPMPQVGITNNPTPNAFATGRGPKNAAVVATTGLLSLLDDRELRGVMAHELAHVKNRDILVMSVAATIAGAISIMARFVIFSTMARREVNPATMAIAVIAYITIPIAAILIQLGISRGREYMADEVGARIANDPRSLASALGKLEIGNIERPMTTENPSSAHMWIASPLGGRKKGGASLFSTHPPIKERIDRLNRMAGKL